MAAILRSQQFEPLLQSEWLMAPVSTRVRIVGSCILGTMFATPAALILASLTARKEGFLVFLFPLAITFTAVVQKGWDRARRRDTEFIREQSKKRYAEGKPPVGVD